MVRSKILTWYLHKAGTSSLEFPLTFIILSDLSPPPPPGSVREIVLLSGTALGEELDDRGFESRQGLHFSLHHRIQTGSEAHPASYPMGTRGSFSGEKRPGREADHSPPSSAEAKNAWSYTSTPPYAFMAWCSDKSQGQLYIYVYRVLTYSLR
jgi:hypothetical protein